MVPARTTPAAAVRAVRWGLLHAVGAGLRGRGTARASWSAGRPDGPQLAGSQLAVSILVQGEERLAGAGDFVRVDRAVMVGIQRLHERRRRGMVVMRGRIGAGRGGRRGAGILGPGRTARRAERQDEEFSFFHIGISKFGGRLHVESPDEKDLRTALLSNDLQSRENC